MTRRAPRHAERRRTRKPLRQWSDPATGSELDGYEDEREVVMGPGKEDGNVV